MRKHCKKCGKEIPSTAKKETCENCLNQNRTVFRKVGQGLLGVVLIGGSLLLPKVFGKFKKS